MIFHKQPDGFSCGASSLVTARMLTDPATRQLASDASQWQALVLQTHRELTGLRDASGRWQVPWPRFLGAPPWTMARAMRALATTPGPSDYRWRWTRFHQPRRPLTPESTGHSTGQSDRSPRKSPAGMTGHLWGRASQTRPVVVYVGSRWLPRHIVLVTGADDVSTTFYDPATGRQARFSHRDWPGPAFQWRTVWGVIAPREVSDPQ